LDLGEEITAGAECEIYFDVGLFFVSGGEIGQGEFQVEAAAMLSCVLLGGERNGIATETQRAQRIRREERKSKEDWDESRFVARFGGVITP